MPAWNMCLVNCTDSLVACIIYVYCSDYICGSIFVAGKNCKYFLLTEDDMCGLVFSNVVISVLFWLYANWCLAFNMCNMF